MKIKRLLIAVVVGFVLASGGLAQAKSTVPMGKDYNNVTIPVFVLNNIVKLSGAQSVDVSNYEVIMFDTEVTIYKNADSANTFILPACTPLTIGSTISTIHVSAACSYLWM